MNFLGYGGLLKKHESIIEALYSSGDLKYFRTKAGKLWLLIRGYDLFKKNFNPDEYVGHVNLRATGNMLDSMTIIKVDAKNGTFQIGWQDAELAEIAYYNELKGRQFLGFTNEERQKLETLAAQKGEFKIMD